METLINNLRQYWAEDQRSFDFYCSMFLAGPAHKNTRKELISYLTGQSIPASKCGLGRCADALKNKFNQPTLF